MSPLPSTTPPPAGTQTPRTDREITEFRERPYVRADFVRQLERELAVALKERDDLDKKLSQARDDIRDMEREIDRLVRMN